MGKHDATILKCADSVRRRLFSRYREVSGPLPTACWIWTGAIRGNGYGIIGFNRNTVATHRAAWIVTHGSGTGELEVCHRCDVRACINPGHLFLGTRSDNMRDCVRKHRHARDNGRTRYRKGEGVKSSRFKASDIIDMRRMAEDGCGIYDIASRYGVRYGTVWGIVNRKSWRHI